PPPVGFDARSWSGLPGGLQIPSREPTCRVAVDIRETLRRGPRLHERPHRLGRRVAAEDNLTAAVAVGDDAEVGDSVPNRGLGKLGNEGVAHVSNRRPCTEVDARRLPERRTGPLDVREDVLSGSALEIGA